MPVDMAATKQSPRFLQCLHYIAPALVLGYFLITTAISAYTLQNLKPSATGPRKVLLPLACLMPISFLLESCMLLIDTNINGARHSSIDSNVSTRSRRSAAQSPHTLSVG